MANKADLNFGDYFGFSHIGVSTVYCANNIGIRALHSSYGGPQNTLAAPAGITLDLAVESDSAVWHLEMNGHQ